MKYDMVFEGGGAKGMVFVGALQEVEKRGHEPARLMGASAGAIMATFLAAGYNAQEMGEALVEMKDGVPVFKGFLEVPPHLSAEELHTNAFRSLLRETNAKLIPDFLEDKMDDALVEALSKNPAINQLLFFFDYGGLYAGQYFLNWLKEKLNAGTYTLDRGSLGKGKSRCFGEMNLEQFFQATGIELSLIGSDTTDARLLVLNHRTAPDLPLVYAVRMSMSFPLLWQEVVWDASWGKYAGREMTGHTIVDGGMLSNFPIELFISNQPYITDVMGEKTVAASQVLGFLIDDSVDVPGAPAPKKGMGLIDNVLGGGIQLKTLQRVGKLINTMTQAHDKLVIDKYEQFVVHLPARTYETTEFDMTEERRAALVTGGRNAAIHYFDTHAMPEADALGLGLDDTGVLSEGFFEKADSVARKILDF